MADGIAAALARAQQKFAPVVKRHTNPHYKSNYADLADVISAVLPALNAEGIAVIQPIEDGDLVTRLLLGDERIESRIRLNLDVKPQELGSQLTYMRRYSLASLIAVASEDDDDGNAAQDAKPQRQRRTPAKRDIPDASDAEIKLITDVFDGMPDEQRKAAKQEFAAKFGKPDELTREQVPEALAYMGLDAPFMKETE